MVILNLAEEVEFFLCRATIVSFVPLSIHVLSLDGSLFCHVSCEPFAEPCCCKTLYGSGHFGLDSKAEQKRCSLLNKI